MQWPDQKQFAFTIIDDTDNATLANVKPVYDFLNSIGVKTTKTVWVYPPRDEYGGDSLQDENYRKYIEELVNKGFEVASHGVGSGKFVRSEILQGFEYYKSIFKSYPKIHINHSQNESNLYWGSKRFTWPVSSVIRLREKTEFQGERNDSVFFWGDFSKANISFIRNLVFNNINTLKCDPRMPYRDQRKDQYSNFWFSSSDGHTVEEFVDLINPKSVDELVKENGCCIIYTHFASGFVDSQGKLNGDFKDRMEYLAKLNGWFVPAGEILTYLQDQKKENDFVSEHYLRRMNINWLISRIKKKVKFNR